MITGTENIRAYWQAAFNAGVSRIEKTPIDITVSGDLAVETSSYVVTVKDQRIASVSASTATFLIAAHACFN